MDGNGVEALPSVCFTGIRTGRLDCRDLGRDEVLADGVGEDPVVDLCKCSVEVPGARVSLAFLFLQPLELLDEIDLEFRTYPHSKLECNVAMGVCASVPTGCCSQPNGVRSFDPVFDADLVAVQTLLTFNCGEFAIIKIRVVNGFANAKELNGVSIAQRRPFPCAVSPYLSP